MKLGLLDDLHKFDNLTVSIWLNMSPEVLVDSGGLKQGTMYVYLNKMIGW